jgi:hypothetical protein
MTWGLKGPPIFDGGGRLMALSGSEVLQEGSAGETRSATFLGCSAYTCGRRYDRN